MLMNHPTTRNKTWSRIPKEREHKTIMFFRFLLLIHVCTAYPLQCPEPAQWPTRARSHCPNPSKYSCLKNDLINGYSENCTISDFLAPGRKGVLRGGLDADICSQERYHPWPIKYYTNVSTNCIFRKSMCNEEGQVTYAKGNHNTDTTCRCDYTRGYDFIGKLRNLCFCVPSEEDCSCYLKTCFDKTYLLSADYECIHEKINTSTSNCRAFNRERVSTERNDSSSEDTTKTENIPTTVQQESHTRMIVIAFFVGFILVYCIYKLRDKSACKVTTLDRMSESLIGHIAGEEDFGHKADRFDKETQKNQKEELDKDWMIKILKKWSNEDKEYFVNTTVSHYVLNCIKQHVCVSVIGPSGVGKTFLVHHVALEMKKIDYRIIKVASPEEIKMDYRLDSRTLFVVDDMCGKFTANKEELNKWKRCINDITDLLDKQSCKLILTCRLQVFQDKEFKHSDLKLFQTCICNLVEGNLALTASEKQQIAKMYFKNIDINKLKHLFKYDFFPFLCQMYVRRNMSNFSEEKYLKDPFAFCEGELDNLLLDCKYKFVALFLLVMCNNHLEEKAFIGKEDKVIKTLDHILEECPVEQFHIVNLKKELEVLTQTFVVIENGTYHAMHDKLFDFLAYYFGKRYNQLLIKQADMELINTRCGIVDQGKFDKTTREEYVIAIEDDNVHLYIERVFDDMTIVNDKTGLLWSNRNKYNKTFQNTLCTFIKNIEKDKISNVIQSASSVFVRDMFVMDVNDIRLDSNERDEHFGIILDKVHLEKYTETMFVGMKTSDDVKGYMKLCRCCKNEVFNNYLLTYMTSLSSTKINELIKSANTSFVQLMFVMEKDEIRPRNSHVYKRYGIVLTDDVIRVYIERVFDDMTRSDDVNEYLICNRNSKNKKFHTELLDYMTHRTKIEQLMKEASTDFIYQLCVMTSDDINENSYMECQRYGVIIPDESLPLYIARWFDDMTKTRSIEFHFEKNRNKHTRKFKTALQTFMTELKEENIEKLIKTANEVFLHKLFVTTKEDILHDSINDYEHYGIVLQNKYMDMYTTRILNSYIRAQDLKCNRIIERVLKCMNQLDPSKITKLIYASDDTVFHQMITVDIGKETKIQNNYSDYQCLSLTRTQMLEMNGGLIKCPFNLTGLYMDRMILDWSQGKLFAVFSNNNLKNQSFLEKFLDLLNQLEPSKISELVNIKSSAIFKSSTLFIICLHGEANLAKWCLENHLHENLEQDQEHNRLFSLFLLVIFNNQLEDSIICDKLIKTTDAKFSFRKMLNIREDISARVVKNELNTSLNRIVVEKQEGVYSAIDGRVFSFLVFYFASIRQMSKVLVEYADEKLLCRWFLVDKSLLHENYFIIQLTDEELLTCNNRVFTKMTNSEKFIKYIFEGDNKTNVNLITAYVKNLKKNEIKTICENSCFYFINKFFVLTANETKEISDEESILTLELPNNSTHVYMKRIFDHITSSDCVESCLQANRNKNNELFRTKLATYMKDLKIYDVERLIALANSDFLNRMFLISEDDIKHESCWEYERYGIVVPKDLLHIYIKRVFRDMGESVYVPVNRNSENKTFRDNLRLYINSLSEDNLASLIKTAGSKFISRLYLSTSVETTHISFPRIESSFMFVSKKYYQILKQILIVKEKQKTWLRSSIFKIKADLSSYTIIAYEYKDCDPVLIEILRKNGIESSKLKQHLIGYIDPLLTGKQIEYYVQATNDLVSKYIQRLLGDWMNGHVHDVIGNINLNISSFQSEFIAHLRKTDHNIQLTLATTSDTNTGHLPLEVCSYVGISELVKWCLDINGEIYRAYVRINSLYIACVQNHPDIVSIILNHTYKADVNNNSLTFYPYTPLCAACLCGYNTIVSLLLKEDVDVNYGLKETPLYVACKQGHFQIVSMLLDKKADKIYINQSPSHAFTGKTPLYVACKKGHAKIVSLLLNHTADTLDVNKNTYEGKTPLYAACKGGYTVIVDLLLAREVRVINKSRLDGASPLFIACQKGHVEVVSTLLKHKTLKIDQCILIGMSSLFIASFLGHTQIVKMLLEKKADASICMEKKEFVMPVVKKIEREYRYASNSKEYIEYTRKLVIRSASTHVKSYSDGKEEGWVFNSIFGASPLHMGSLMGHTEIVKLLVLKTNNLNINCFSENGNTPLLLACELGHADIVHVLLSNGADPTLDRKDGKSPLTIAQNNGHMKIVEILNSKQ